MGRAHSLFLPHRYVTGTDARILSAEELALKTACSSPHITVSVISQARVAPVRPECLLSSSPFLPVVTCVSLLPFSQITQPTYLLLLPTLITHLTATGTAPPNKKMHFTSPQFHQDSIPRLEQHHPSLFLATALPNATRVAARP